MEFGDLFCKVTRCLSSKIGKSDYGRALRNLFCVNIVTSWKEFFIIQEKKML